MISNTSPKKNIILCELCQAHIDQTFSWILNDNLRRDFMMRGKPNKETHIKYFNKILSDPSQHWYAIYCEDEHIGNCGFKWIDEVTKIVTIWIYIGDETYKGKGNGYLATRELLNIVFNQYSIDHVILHVAEFNKKAVDMYNKLGFHQISLDETDMEWKNRDTTVIKMQLSKDDFK